MWGERFDSTQLAAVHGMRRRKSTAPQGGDAELGWRTCLPTHKLCRMEEHDLREHDENQHEDPVFLVAL